jgi:anti-sigma regulatory factor (Ser/Thr protein kinase)
VEMIGSARHSIRVVVSEMSGVGESRRRASTLADQLGFDQVLQGKAALVATEAASNLVKHAGGGEVVLSGIDLGWARPSLEILALDKGSGMSDVARCLADGYSSAGTAGTGLGAISRGADAFDIYSAAGDGTAVWARLQSGQPPAALSVPALEVGVTSIPAPGEEVCGDHWATVTRDGFAFVLVVDGLGHGPPAAAASDEAVRVFREHRSHEPADIIESSHRALRATRGAALAIARIDVKNGGIRYAGIGNIAGVVLSSQTDQSSSLVSLNGTVGYTIRKIQSFDYRWSHDSLLLMHSDGLATHWNLKRYAGLKSRRPGLIAGVLYRDNKRTRDDVTVLVARAETGGRP